MLWCSGRCEAAGVFCCFGHVFQVGFPDRRCTFPKTNIWATPERRPLQKETIVFQPSTVFLEAMLVCSFWGVYLKIPDFYRTKPLRCNFFVMIYVHAKNCWPLKIPSPLSFACPKSIHPAIHCNPLVRPWCRRAFGSVFWKPCFFPEEKILLWWTVLFSTR